MANVLVLGAGGQIARWVIRMLKNSDAVALTLFLRDARKLDGIAPEGATVVEGDVLDRDLLRRSMPGQDIVYANLGGDNVDRQVEGILDAIKASDVKRFIFVASLGIYNEVPGKFGAWNRDQIGAYLPPIRKAADAIEASPVNYTILRPAWLTDANEVDYETTERNEPFQGTEVSRKSVAALITKLIGSPELSPRSNLGVNKPNTDGDKPAFV